MGKDAEAAASDGGDFCGFVSGCTPRASPMYVGVPSNAAVCDGVAALGGIDVVRALPCLISQGEASRGAGYPLRVIAHDVRSFHPGQVRAAVRGAQLNAAGRWQRLSP